MDAVVVYLQTILVFLRKLLPKLLKLFEDELWANVAALHRVRECTGCPNVHSDDREMHPPAGVPDDH